ncbi:MAG TPA: hypothetical protein VFZ58_04550 [Candidatus Saccharimonadales bacterium]
MDFNDLNAKLKRLYVALGEQYDENISSNIVDSHTVFDDGRFEHRTTFGTNKPEQNQYIIMNAIHHIGLLKDIIKAKLNDPRLYEQLIDSHQSLALATDLDNKDKHGDPLSHPQRSDKDPRIANIAQVLRGRGITRAAFTTDLTTGLTKMNTVEGNVKIVIMADVIDSEGVPIMPLDEMLEESLKIIEEFLKAHKLV